MLVVLTVVLAAALLIFGTLADNQPLVIGAGVISLIMIVILVAGRLAGSRRETGDGVGDGDIDADPDAEQVEIGPEDVTTDEPVPDQAVQFEQPENQPLSSRDPDQTQVVFLVGRTTFHLPTCSVVADRSVSSGTRSELEAGGMTRCRRCLAN